MATESKTRKAMLPIKGEWGIYPVVYEPVPIILGKEPPDTAYDLSLEPWQREAIKRLPLLSQEQFRREYLQEWDMTGRWTAKFDSQPEPPEPPKRTTHKAREMATKIDPDDPFGDRAWMAKRRKDAWRR